jgi:hypothetical protein
MSLRTLALAALACALFAIPRAGETRGAEVFPLAKVRPGLKGYGLTVFAGTKPERFEFEVIGVARNFLPKQDIILFKSDDPKMKDVGIARGMSGSPMYLEGKVACALAYGWGWNKKTIGGCTPIQYMIDDARLPLRGPDKTSQASIQEWTRHEPLSRFAAAREVMGARGAPANAWLTQAPLPTATVPVAASGTDGLVRAGVPLAVSGFAPTALAQARELFAPYGLEPVQSGGGAGSATEGPTAFEMGGPIGVTLVEGDTSASATGTVSYLDGTRVIAFGHPMFGMGEAYLPITAAHIHTIIPSVNSSFKLSSPMRMLGSLIMDRQSSIAGDTALRAELIPVTVKARSPSGEHVFRANVIRHRFLTPQLVMLVVSNAAEATVPDISDATLLLKSTLALRGHEPLSFTDYVYSAEGASANAIGAARALRALVPVLFNPFAPAHLERIEIDLTVSYKKEFTELAGIRVPSVELPYGEKTYVEVTLRPFGGKEYVEKIPLVVPERLAGSVVKVEVVPGDVARPDVAPPTSLDDVIEALRRTYPSNTLVATIYTPDEGVSIDGRVLPDLPDSAIDTVRPATSSRRPEAYKSITRAVIPSKRVVMGKQELVVKIQDRK